MKSFDEFMNELELKCRALGVDSEPLAEKYRKRMALAKEAGLTEEEAVLKFGSVEKIVAEAACSEEKEETGNKNALRKMKLFSMDIAHSCDVIVDETDEDAITVELDEELLRLYKVTHDDNEFILKPIYSSKSKYRVNGDIHIGIGKNLSFDKLRIDSVGAEVRLCSLKADDIRISTVSGDVSSDGLSGNRISVETVSGDFDVKTIRADELNVSMVSGDVIIHSGTANKTSVSTVSGDVDLTGHFENVKSSCVSGDVTVNSKRTGKNLGETIRSFFKS